MKRQLSLFFLIIAFTQINASAQTFYLNKEILFYEGDDSINTKVISRQMFDTLGRLVYEENVDWDKTWFTYEDTFLVSKIHVEPSDSMDNLAEKTFPHFYNDTTIYFYKNTFNKKGQLIYRSDSIRKFTAKKPAGCVQYEDETFDYTRIWIDFKDRKTIEYDSIGRKISEKSKYENRRWKYDSIGRLIEKFDWGITQLIRYNLTGKEEMTILNYTEKSDTIKTDISYKKEFDKQGRVIKEIEIGRAIDREHTITLLYNYKEDELDEKRIEKSTYRNYTTINTYITISKNKRTLTPKK